MKRKKMKIDEQFENWAMENGLDLFRGDGYYYHSAETDKSFKAWKAGQKVNAETIAKLREALKPFTHDDLCETLGGNVEGDESPVFNRNHAMLKLKDFSKARAVLSETEGK